MKTPRVLPPHYFFLSLVAMFALAYIFDDSLWPGAWRLAGIVPIAAGLTVAFVAVRQFKKAQTNIVPLTKSTTLVADGIFSVSRNPMYIGMIGVLSGTALLLNNLWPWLVIVAFWAMIRFGFVRPEEALMEKTFGEQYREYKNKVRRWL